MKIKLQNAATRLFLMGLVAMAGATGRAQQQTTVARPSTLSTAAPAAGKPVVEEEQAPAAKPDGASHEGIKVHGHWIIDVKNPDGSHVSHTEFENSLVPGQGDYTVARMLLGDLVSGGFAIAVDSTTSSALCPGNGMGGRFPANSCLLVQSSNASSNLIAYYLCSTLCFPGMTAYWDNSNPNLPVFIQLQGSFTVPVGGPITGVHTYIAECPGSTAATACIASTDAGSLFLFTGTTLANAINVVAGQYVMVTVKISFS